METVILKNGAEETKPLVVVMMGKLETLMKETPLVFYDLVMLCRDSTYQPFGGAGEDLKTLGFVNSDGSVHQSIRNVVLSATNSDGMEMTLGSPVKQ